MSELKLCIGRTQTGTPIVEHGLGNPHLSIMGRSGSGKSFFLRGLIEQAAQQSVSCLVLDYSADFRDYVPPSSIPFRRIGVTDPNFTINPLAASAARGGLAAAQQLLSAIHSVFRMGSRATVALQKVTISYLGQAECPTLTGLLRYIDVMEEKSIGLRTATEPVELLSTLVHCGNVNAEIKL